MMGLEVELMYQKTEFTKRTRVMIWKKNRRSQESRRGRKTLSSIP